MAARVASVYVAPRELAFEPCKRGRCRLYSESRITVRM